MTATTPGIASKSLESVARPFLDLLHMVTGLESTYLTEVDSAEGRQTVMFSQNRGPLTIAEGISVDWDESVCKRAIESNEPLQQNVQSRHADLGIVRSTGIDAYVGVPVFSSGDEVVGTLCGASQRSADVDPDAVAIMQLFAGLIADRWESDRQSRRLTERVELAERRIKDRATFLAAAEHKLKSPVTVIRGWAEELDASWDKTSEDVRRKGISVIARASTQLSMQVSDLLEEARNEVVATDLRASRVEIAPIITGAVSDLSTTSTAHEVRAEGEMSQWVRADANALWHALVHLIENAIKYSPEGGPVIVRTRQVANRVLIDVIDHGPGIPEKVDIFEPFVRAQGNDSTDVGGSGLGLHVVRTLMRAMDGDVSAQCNPEVGSTFTLHLQPA